MEHLSKRNQSMNTVELAAGLSSAIICLLVFGWYLCCRCSKTIRKPDRILMISECLQPHLICRTIPCQHPYYRVISEYNNKARPMPDIEEQPEESSQECDNREFRPFRILPERRPRFYSQDERFKSSLPGLPRRHSMISGSYRKHSNSSSVSSSRRSSDASSSASIPVSPIFQTKPTILTQTEGYCQI